MGQYYSPILISSQKSKWGNIISSDDMLRVDPMDFGSGYKLMEHAFIGNNVCNVVCNQLRDKPLRILWMGDYTEKKDCKAIHICPSAFKAIYKKSMTEGKEAAPKIVPNNKNWEFDYSKPWLLINISKKQFVRFPIVPEEELDWQVHPLPLLTATSNGRGGGDYFDTRPHYDKVGIWAGDWLYLSCNKESVAGYEELDINFGKEME